MTSARPALDSGPRAPVVAERVVRRQHHVGHPPLAVPQGSDPLPFDDVITEVQDGPEGPGRVAFNLTDVSRGRATVAHADQLPIENPVGGQCRYAVFRSSSGHLRRMFIRLAYMDSAGLPELTLEPVGVHLWRVWSPTVDESADEPLERWVHRSSGVRPR